MFSLTRPSFGSSSYWQGAGGAGRTFDRSVLCGICLSIVLIAVGIYGSGGSVLRFLDVTGFLIVVGGTCGATLVHFSVSELTRAGHALREVLLTRPQYPLDRISALVKLAQSVRINGVVFLDRAAQDESDGFFRRALQLAADGQPPEEIRRILQIEVRTSSDAAWRAAQVFDVMGTFAPALGLIGTVIGLIQMMGELGNPATVGPAMAVALVATFYGAVLANLLFLPLAGKLRNRSEEDSRVKAITIEGVMSLSRQENPLVMEQRLYGFMPAAK